MITKQHIQKLLPYVGSSRLILKDQVVNDIIKEVLAAHVLYQSHYDKIANNFLSSNAQNTAKKIFDFIKKNIPYKVEQEEGQTSKSPGRLLRDGHGDCKHYAGFIAGILDALKRQGKNISWTYRFASYKMLRTTPHHVFVVLNPGTENETWIDPVLPTFNNRKRYYHHIDRTPYKSQLQTASNMALYRLSGIGAARRAPRRKNSAPGAKPGGKKKGIFKGVVKFAASPARNAYLALVGLNFKGMATRLAESLKTQEIALQRKWESLGGNFSKLKNTILKGASKKRIGETGTVEYNGVGAAPAALAASAAPIILKMAQFGGKGALKGAAKTALTTAAKGAAKKTLKKKAVAKLKQKGLSLLKKGVAKGKTLLNQAQQLEQDTRKDEGYTATETTDDQINTGGGEGAPIAATPMENQNINQNNGSTKPGMNKAIIIGGALALIAAVYLGNKNRN